MLKTGGGTSPAPAWVCSEAVFGTLRAGKRVIVSVSPPQQGVTLPRYPSNPIVQWGMLKRSYLIPF